MYDNNNHYWSGDNTFAGRNSEPPCAPTTTSGTITLTLGSCTTPVTPSNGGSPDNWQFTLTGNGTLAVTGPYKAGHTFVTKITEGASTPFTLGVSSGFFVQGLCTSAGVPTSYCTFNGELALSGTASGKNILTCQIINTTPTIWCGPVLAGLTTLAPISIAQTAGSTQCPTGGSGDATGGTTCSGATLTLTSGNDLIIGAGFCVINDCVTAPSTLTLNTLSGTNLTSCTFLTRNAASALMKSELWRCHVSSSGSTHPALTWSSSAYYAFTYMWEVAGLASSPDDGVGATASGTGITPTAALSGGGATQGDGEIVLLTAYCNLATEAVSGTGWVSDSTGSGKNAHKFTTATGAQTPTIGCPANTGTNPWTTSIAALKHP